MTDDRPFRRPWPEYRLLAVDYQVRKWTREVHQDE